MDAVLTLGNKKSVDIAVVPSAGDSVTVDVKGLAGKTGWPVDNVREGRAEHFVVFVCYAGRIENIETPPDVWIIPSMKLEPFIYLAPGVQRSKLLKDAKEFFNAWSLIAGD